jgi:hypothetical protein
MDVNVHSTHIMGRFSRRLRDVEIPSEEPLPSVKPFMSDLTNIGEDHFTSCYYRYTHDCHRIGKWKRDEAGSAPLRQGPVVFRR